MRTKILLIVAFMVSAVVAQAQKWEQLSDEQKLNKLQSFRNENQKYLKDSLKLTQVQMNDIDNLNMCFLSTLDRVDRYAKEKQTKEEYADALWEVRWAQMDAIMGKQKHDKYAAYIERRLKTAVQKKQI